MLYENLSINSCGHLVFSGKDTLELSKKYGTPLFVMDESRIRNRCRIYKTALNESLGKNSFPIFAGKALCFKGLYRIIAEEEIGIDVVSPGEIYTAFSAGFPMERAFFHGNNKTESDIEFAIDKQVGFFVCDSREELISVDRKAREKGVKQKILLRVTPGIDPHTHEKISTGKVDSKFGVPIENGQALEIASLALSLENIDVKGFHCHIGSQIFECKPFTDAAKIMLGFIAAVKEKTGYETEIFNIGGGMGVRYTENDPEIDYAANIKAIAKTVLSESQRLKIKTPALLMEPGRSIVADAGITLYSVGGIKQIPGVRNYVSIDGGMTDNPRYTLYSSSYTVLNASKIDKPASYLCTIAGRCCESGDLIQENVYIAEPERNDILAVLTTGAYNYSMSSNYNAIPKPPIVMITESGEEQLAVRRESYEHMTGCQI